MNDDHRELWDDACRDEISNAFQTEALTTLLRGAKRRRVRRAVVRSGAAGVAVLAAAVLTWFGRPHRSTVDVVRTQSFASDAIISTRHFIPVATSTTVRAVAVVETRFGGFGIIDDQQLLRLTSPHTVALVRVSADSERLIWLDSPEQKPN